MRTNEKGKMKITKRKITICTMCISALELNVEILWCSVSMPTERLYSASILVSVAHYRRHVVRPSIYSIPSTGNVCAQQLSPIVDFASKYNISSYFWLMENDNRMKRRGITVLSTTFFSQFVIELFSFSFRVHKTPFAR